MFPILSEVFIIFCYFLSVDVQSRIPQFPRNSRFDWHKEFHRNLHQERIVKPLDNILIFEEPFRDVRSDFLLPDPTSKFVILSSQRILVPLYCSCDNLNLLLTECFKNNFRRTLLSFSLLSLT